MDMLLNLRAFLATARTGSFSEAARQLHVVPSVVAKRVSQLEGSTGVQLFNRSTRQVSLTERGHQFLPKARALIEDFDVIVSGMGRQEDANGLEGHIRIKAPTSLSVLYLNQLLAAFQRSHERITMEVFLVDRSVHPVEEGFDIALGGISASYDGVLDEPICPLRQVVCATPDYLERHGTPRHPRELADHPCLVFRPTGTTWRFRHARGPIEVEVAAKLSSNDTSMLFAAARAGTGIAVLPTYLTREALKEGELTPLLADFPLQEIWLKALVPARRAAARRIQALLAYFKEQLSPVPPWDRA
jgi:DNA-binding transcriptional LysR family regulator